jgi:hypothetical protein
MLMGEGPSGFAANPSAFATGAQGLALDCVPSFTAGPPFFGPSTDFGAALTRTGAPVLALWVGVFSGSTGCKSPAKIGSG